MPNNGQKSLKCRTRTLGAVLISCAISCFSISASAQDAAKTDSLNEAKTVQPTEGLNFNLPVTSNFETQTGLQLELPIEAIGSTMFKLDLTSPGCVNGSDTCVSRDDSVKLGLSDTFRRRSEKGLDLSLTPRASMRFNDELSSTAVGAMIEIGEDLRDGSEFKSNTWYVFAGADAEALTYSPHSVGQVTAGEFHLRDRVIVGDAQAGLGYRIGDADVSLSYKRREASTDETTYKEDAAALSFTWKR